jgi:phospholipid/cholesterol/gamma-HCH transport system permease protein
MPAAASLPATNVGRGDAQIVAQTADTLELRVSGTWQARLGLPALDQIRSRLTATPRVRRLVLTADGLGDWDSALLAFLLKLDALCRAGKIQTDASQLPDGVRRLLALATAVPERAGTARGGKPVDFVTKVGKSALGSLAGFRDAIGFVGELAIAFARFLVGRARIRRSDLMLFIQECGAQALGIVSIISLLVGLIFAFVGAVQLRQFGAQIFVANLVAIAMAREMAAVMTGIVLAGRTGAAFAAQLGTMQTNEEIDALSTLGISPMEFLVLPRMLALILMTPLLCIYANVVGLIGGWLVGALLLDLPSTAYISQTLGAVTLTDFAIGIGKSVVFGILVAIAGCMKGIRSGRSAAAVGEAAPAAVVAGILYIIITDGVFAVALNMLGL